MKQLYWPLLMISDYRFVKHSSSLLVLLYPSAAFGTVSHDNLMDRLQSICGVKCKVVYYFVDPNIKAKNTIHVILLLGPTCQT